MKHLLISKGSVNYADDGAASVIGGAWEIDDLTTGGIAVLGADGTLIAEAAATVVDKQLQFAVGTPENMQVTPMIARNGFSYSKQAYVAPVKSKKFLGSDTAGSAGSYSLNLPTSLSVGDTVGIAIIDKSKPMEDLTGTKIYSFSVISGDLLTLTTSKNIIAKLVALINADTTRIVDATALNDATNNDGIQFLAKTAGIDFAVAHIDGSSTTKASILADADIVEYLKVNGAYDATSTNGVANNPGQGTYAQISALEAEYSSREGNQGSNFLTNEMFNVASKAVVGETYVLYTLHFTPANDDDLIKHNRPNQICELAIPSSETGATKAIAALDNILAKFAA